MIVLCSAIENIRRRWREALSGFPELVDSASLGALESLLDNDPPQLVVLHLALPQLNGVTGITRLRERHPEIKFLVLADTPGQQEGFALFRNGIRGYANTYTSHAYLVEAVKVILVGDVWLGSQLLRGLVAELARVIPESDGGVPPGFERLTARERDILASLAGGQNNKTIAARLGITERTVKAHLSSIFQKTGLKDRLHLALAAQALEHKQAVQARRPRAPGRAKGRD